MDPELAAQRFQETVRLHEEGIALMRQNLRRRHPDETEQEIDQRLDDWLLDRPLPANLVREAPS